MCPLLCCTRCAAAEQRRADRREALLRKLESTQPGSRTLVEWLAATRASGGFIRRVLGPVLLEMSPVADAGWAGYLEQVIGRRGLCTVVTEHMCVGAGPLACGREGLARQAVWHSGMGLWAWLELHRRAPRQVRLSCVGHHPGNAC
jgi:hypothetical protein